MTKRLSNDHKLAISKGLHEYHRSKRKPKSMIGRIAGAVKSLRKGRALHLKKKELNKLYLDLRLHKPGDPGHVPHLKKIDKAKRELKRMENKGFM